MRPIALFLIFTALCSSLFAQKPGDRYLDQLDPGSKLLRASYHQTFEKTPDKRYVQKTFYPETKQITHRVTYSDKIGEIMDGPYMEWYDKGYKWMEGQYAYNLREGVWTYYSFDTGEVSEYGNYKEDKRAGKWVNLDSLARVQVETFYVDGEMHGERKVFDENGALTRLTIYEKGKVVSEQQYEGGVPVEATDKSEVMPFLKGCEQEDMELQKQCSEKKMLEALYKNIEYPAIARDNDVQGQALFQFVIEKDGSLVQLQTMRGICKPIEEECLRVIKLMPEWNPGMQNGVPVRVRFTLPIRFKLE